jgi:hypothetical protein
VKEGNTTKPQRTGFTAGQERYHVTDMTGRGFSDFQLACSIDEIDAAENGLPRSFMMPRKASSAEISRSDRDRPSASCDAIDEPTRQALGVAQRGSCGPRPCGP